MNLQTASLAQLLNPNTKEITKSESNKIQQVETKRWNTSAKKQIYGPSTGLYYKKFQRRPTIQLLKEQEGTVQARDRQVCMNTAFIAYQNTAQNIYNENTDNLVEHYREERLKQVERSLHSIIRSFCAYMTTLEEEERYTQNTLKGIVTVCPGIRPNG